MDTTLWRWLSVFALLAISAAEAIGPSNSTIVYDGQSGNNNQIKLSLSEGDGMGQPLYEVVGLTSHSNSDMPPIALSGVVFLANPSNQANLKSDQVALISCDPIAGYIGASDVLSEAASKNVKAVLMYSEYSVWCDLEDYSGSYQWIYSMTSAESTKEMLKKVNNPDQTDNGKIYATINSTNESVTPSSQHSNDKNNNNNNSSKWVGRSTTAVAMIILYSITGLITALFLLIIITGAFRAHRHPERYGPRNVAGGPRQSRAKGLARALLDTLPIVKFGEREDPKTTDVELAGTNSEAPATRDGQQNATAGESNTTESPAAPGETGEARRSVEGGIAAAVDTSQSTPNRFGCSICTEDFETGQDQRVLPCDHRFHPECVDPWLLNVSGTCPLCRIDLRPSTARTSGSAEVGEDGNPVLREGQFEPPPLGPQETPGEQRRMSIRQSITLGIMGIGRPDRMTREERVLALRRLRGQQLARQRREQQASAAETPEEATRTRRRLRDVLGIRTRRTTTTVTSATDATGEGQIDTANLESRETLESRSGT